MTMPIRSNPFVLPVAQVLEPGVVLMCRHLQQKGFTFTEIAERLQLDREDVVHELYWSVSK
jgi:hypothetical protein